jgi:hypothetical protein
MYACKPRVDPTILLHDDPRAWVELLGWGCIEVFTSAARPVGVKDLDGLVKYSTTRPGVFAELLRGVEFFGKYAAEWSGLTRGRIYLGARTPFPHLPAAAERDELVILASPAIALLPPDSKRLWQKRAYVLLRLLSEVPVRNLRLHLSQRLPEEWRFQGLSYVEVANARCGGRRCILWAEWLYWIEQGRMPHIDLRLGKFAERAKQDKLLTSLAKDLEEYWINVKKPAASCWHLQRAEVANNTEGVP